MLTIVPAVRAAFSFLTRIPMGSFRADEAVWRWSTAHFPLVGAALGLLGAGVYLLLVPAGELVAATAAFCALVMATGAFHEDGLADTADALGGGFEKERVAAILKDSRIGSFGAAALFLALIIRVAATASLGTDAPAAIVVTQCASRLPPVWLMVFSPYITPNAASKSRLVTRARWPQAAVASSWAIGLVAAALWFDEISFEAAAAVAAAAIVCLAYMGWRFHKRLGGITGDFLGALQLVTECTMLTAWAWTTGAFS